MSQTNLRLIFKNKTKHWAWNWKLGFYPHLDKKWNGVEPSDDDSVVHISGQDVQSSCATFHYFLHAHTLLYDSSFHEMKGRKGEKNNKKTKTKKHHILDVQIKKTSSLLHTTNCCWLPPMLVRLWVSWWALTSSCTSRGIAPCSRKALWLAGQRARLRIRPTVAYKGRNIWHI